MNLGLDARASILRAFGATGGANRSAVAFREAAVMVRAAVAEHDERPTGIAWHAYATALDAVARLVDWKDAVRKAERDSGRHLESARLLAQERAATLDSTDPLHGPLRGVLDQIAAVSSPAHVEPCLARLCALPLPLPISKPSPPLREYALKAEETLPDPIAVALFNLNGEPAPDVAVVAANQFNNLRLQLRVTEWPEWARHLETVAISVAGENATFPPFRFQRPAERDKDGFWTVEAEGKLVIKASQPLDSDPIGFTLIAEFVSRDRRRKSSLRTAGQRELRLWATDTTRATFLTGYPQLDKRVADIFALLYGNTAFGPEHERAAFRRLLLALLRVTTAMQTWNYYTDSNVTESQFQKDLLVHLQQNSELEGRLLKGSEVGAGKTDIVHDKIVAELKVEKEKAVTEEGAKQYLGQTTSYSSGLGSQLGIAVILDLSPKKNPVGAPANYIYWLRPRVHGQNDPPYPSHVAVLVVNGNLPRPSDFAGKRIETLDSGGPPSPIAGEHPSQ